MDEYHNNIITIEIAYTHLNINNLVRFKYPVGPVYLFFNGGISNGLVIKETNLRENDYYLANRVEKEPALLKPSVRDRGLIMGAGIKYNRFSFEARLIKGEGTDKYGTVVSKTTKYLFLLGYKF